MRFKTITARLRREVKAALESGQSCGCAKTAATCFEILKVEEGLWTFVRVEGVEPTNNGPERALRHAVICAGSVAGPTVPMAAGLWSGC